MRLSGIVHLRVRPDQSIRRRADFEVSSHKQHSLPGTEDRVTYRTFLDSLTSALHPRLRSGRASRRPVVSRHHVRNLSDRPVLL